MQITMNSQELWDSIEQQIADIRHKEWLDAVLVDKFDSLFNHYNGAISSNDFRFVFGALESLTDTLSKDDYYKNRRYKDVEMIHLQKLNEDLLIFQKVIGQEVRAEANKPEVKPVLKERLPNLDPKNETDLYENTSKRERL